MSDAEKKKRAEYKKKRKRWLVAWAVVLVVVALGLIGSFIAYGRLTETVYISYSEKSAVDYKVKYKENDFYEDDLQDANQAYVVSLIEQVQADFSYALKMDSKNARYEYTYGVIGQMTIVDNHTKKTIFEKPYELLAPKTARTDSSTLNISEHIEVDYATYNELAKTFMDTYGLPDSTATLALNMNITVIGSCKDFKEKSRNNYVVSLHIPVAVKTMEVKMTSTVPTGNGKVLACDSGFDKDGFKTALITVSAVEAGLLLGFVAFVLATRNADINYTIKVKKLVSNYRSYVQKINNGFDTAGYQLLAVDSFGEMLAIRDTIQSPILMSENKDQTRTVFFIPTNTKILYTFEVKVDNYDELYRDSDDKNGSEVFKEESAPTPTPAQENGEEEVSIAKAEEPKEELTQEIAQTESVEQAEPIEQVAEIEPQAEEPTEETGDGEAESGYNFGPRMDYSFEARLILSDEEVKGYYKQIADFVRAYGGAKLSRSWKRERVHKGRKLFASISFRANKLVVAFAKDPIGADAKYHAKDVSGLKRYEGTPMLMRITSERKVKYAIELLTELFEAEGLKNEKLTVKPTAIPKKSKTTLLKNNLIKIETA